MAVAEYGSQVFLKSLIIGFRGVGSAGCCLSCRTSIQHLLVEVLPQQRELLVLLLLIVKLGEPPNAVIEPEHKPERYKANP